MDRREDIITPASNHSTENDTTRKIITTTSQQLERQMRHEFSTLLPPVAGILKIEGDMVTAANAVVLPMVAEQTTEQTASIPCDGAQTNKQQPNLLNEQQQQQQQSTEQPEEQKDERQTRIRNYEKNYGSFTQLDLQKENRGGTVLVMYGGTTSIKMSPPWFLENYTWTPISTYRSP